MQNIAFIGLGRMGLSMAKNLSQSDYRVLGYDVSMQVQEQVRNTKIQLCHSLDECVESADIVISMLPACQHVLDLYLGSTEQAGLLDRLSESTLIIDCSTVSRDTAVTLA